MGNSVNGSSCCALEAESGRADKLAGTGPWARLAGLQPSTGYLQILLRDSEIHAGLGVSELRRPRFLVYAGAAAAAAAARWPKWSETLCRRCQLARTTCRQSRVTFSRCSHRSRQGRGATCIIYAFILLKFLFSTYAVLSNRWFGCPTRGFGSIFFGRKTWASERYRMRRR